MMLKFGERRRMGSSGGIEVREVEMAEVRGGKRK
jgi:hypothetical protein